MNLTSNESFVCRLVHRGSTDDLLLLQISRDLNLSHNTLYLLIPRLCCFIVLKRDLFVYRDDSLKVIEVYRGLL